MARSNNNLNAVLKDTADAIRAKKNTSEPIVPRDFADEIDSIQSGGGDDYVNLLADNLQDVVVPSIFGQGEHELRPGAFAYAYDLKKIDFNNEDEVPENCCAYCNRLIEAQGNEVEIIKQYAFYGDIRLESISFPKCEIVNPAALQVSPG